MQDKIIKFAVAGCGHIGKRHAAMIAANPDCQLAAFCDPQPKALLNLSGFDVPFFPNLAALLASDVDFDVLTIATPNDLHEPQALAALDAGKHVLIEKPMALTKSGCERIIFKALQRQKQVFCVMQNRYSPPSVWLKNLCATGALGRIFQVQINCFWNRDDRYYKPNTTADNAAKWHGTRAQDGGTLFTQFSHFVDLLYWCFGDIKNIQTRSANFSHTHSTEFEDSGIVHFDFVDGGMGSLNFSTAVWDKNMESSITILAENGAIKIGGQYMDTLEYCHVKNVETPAFSVENGNISFGNYKGAAANHHFIIENVVSALRGYSAITTNALEGMKVVEIIERIYASL